MSYIHEEDNRGLYLLNKSKRGFFYILFSRLGVVLILLLLQVGVLFSLFRMFEEILPYIYGGAVVLIFVAVTYLINSRMDPTAKITWLIVVMIMPVFGVLLYVYTQSEIGHRLERKRIDELNKRYCGYLKQSGEVEKNLEAEDPAINRLAHYIQRTGSYPVFQNSEVKYFPLGEDKWEEMLKQLEAAKHFIFLEYFIIDEGVMWATVLEILARKVMEGVEVRVMYDGSCEFSTLPHNYPERLAKLGIKCKMFSPLSVMMSTHYNYRDHRKILVIDGHTAFNGGVNLADEYVNRRERFGHWKDTAVMIKGDAVRSYTMMFLQMWSVTERDENFEKYLSYPTYSPENVKGFVLPYGDCPLDDEKVGERVYMDILNRATDYVYIMSPYLILDGEMETALKFAAERGVRVSLILPGIPDKKIPYALAKTHYASLLDSGVEILEYTPGFVHAKVFVADDREAVVGTINLDYRSLYHHFECATYMYKTDCIDEIRDDFLATREKCVCVTKESRKQIRVITKLVGVLAKVIAPLM